MKTFLKSLLGIALCVVLLSSCQKDKQENLQGSVVFGTQTKSTLSSKNIKTEPNAIAAAIIVTIEKNGGGIVYDREKLNLSYLNGSYLSKGLPLSQGNYNLTEFLVLDANNQVIYATPKRGSILAQLVNNPLPLNFDAYSNHESLLIPEVIKTDTSSLEDLGYIGFSFNYVKSLKFLITVFSKNINETQFKGVDSSNLSITPPNNLYIHYDFKLGAAFVVNPIYLRKDTGKYILTIWKQGYNSWADTLSESQLEGYSTTPLNVVLTPIVGPCIWFFGRTTGYNNPNDLIPGISVKPGSILYIDYGRGQSAPVPSDLITRDGYYDDRLIQIYGDVSGITGLSFLGERLNAIYFSNSNIKNATFLQEFTLSYVDMEGLELQNMQFLKNVSYNGGRPALNFTNCTRLESISINPLFHYDILGSDTINIRTNDSLKTIQFDGRNPVLFGKNPNLKTIHIFSISYYPTVEMLNRLLIGLLTSVESAPRSGEFTIRQVDPYFNTLPTGEGLQAAKTLETLYNWSMPF